MPFILAVLEVCLVVHLALHGKAEVVVELIKVLLKVEVVNAAMGSGVARGGRPGARH